MQGVVEFVKGWQLHPAVDHFTVALIVVGIVIDLFASLASSRLWLRSMAATLMVLGAVAAAASNLTGGWEAERVWQNLTGPAKDLLKQHAEIGDILPWVFGGLAVWRLGIQFIGFFARTRVIYLLVAIVGAGAILYQGDLGGDLVYDYGVGTALTAKQPSASPAASIAAPEPSGPIPTVYVPPPTPVVAPSPAAPTASASPAPTPSAAIPSPATTPAASVGTEVSPPPGGAAPPSAAGSPESKSTTL